MIGIITAEELERLGGQRVGGRDSPSETFLCKGYNRGTPPRRADGKRRRLV
jgi:hypothetical protein